MADQGKGLDTDRMEDLIQKMLEKYGESEEQAESNRTPEETTSHDVPKHTDSATRQADRSVNDMIRRETPRWDKVYGTEDNPNPASSTDWSGRRETGGRATTSTEDGFTYPAEIGSVIRSQTGVAKQLISVSEGLDELNDDLEQMKRELKRIQTKSYTCLDDEDTRVHAKSYACLDDGDTRIPTKSYTCLDDGETRIPTRAYTRLDDGDTRIQTKVYTCLDGGETPPSWQTPKEFGFTRVITKDDINRYRSEERDGVVRFGNGNNVNDTERYLKAYQAPVSYLPGAGRAHIRESDIEVTNLLTIADPVQPNRQTRSTVDAGAAKRERNIQVDRSGRPITQYVSVDESSSKHDDDSWRVKGSHTKSHRDGYCYMCEEFGDTNTEWKSKPSYAEALKVAPKPHNHRYSPLSVVADLHESNISSRRTREDMGIYKSPSGVYFYSDDGGSFPNEIDTSTELIARRTVRQSSVPRFFQSQTQPVTSHRFLSQTSRPNTEFTSRFLTKVRRRNSIGGRIDTDRYRGQTLRSY